MSKLMQNRVLNAVDSRLFWFILYAVQRNLRIGTRPDDIGSNRMGSLGLFRNLQTPDILVYDHIDCYIHVLR